MKLKEELKIRKRMCDYYDKCDDCPLFSNGCIDTMMELVEFDEYEKILEEWAKEHPVVTNADKFIEKIKDTFGYAPEKQCVKQTCLRYAVGIECSAKCFDCLKWWNEEYKEPVKEKEQ